LIASAVLKAKWWFVATISRAIADMAVRDHLVQDLVARRSFRVGQLCILKTGLSMTLNNVQIIANLNIQVHKGIETWALLRKIGSVPFRVL
jgi:hypothetical protein